MDGSLSDLRILVAEDNEINRRMVSSMLTRLGITADFVENGREAVDRVLERPYDIVLMDMMMPDMNGLEATREIRRRQVGDRVAIVALTANASGEHRSECLESGMDDYLAKPFTKQALAGLIRRVHRKSRPPEIDRSRFDAFQASLGPDSDEFIADLIGDYLTEANRFRSEIHAGLDTHDAETVRRAAHTLSSNSRTFGAERLAEGQRLHEQRSVLTCIGHDAGGGARQIADVEDQLPPQLARFPPALVGRVAAKAQVQGQGDAEDGEGREAEIAQVPPQVPDRPYDRRRVQTEAQHVGQDAGHDRAVQDEE